MSGQKIDQPTRRAFVQAGGAAVVGLGLSAERLKGTPQETLAMDGGPKAVTYPKDRQTELTKWPRYGAEEKKALHDLIDSGAVLRGTAGFRKGMEGLYEIGLRQGAHEWLERPDEHVLRPGPAAGFRDHGAVLHLLLRLPGDAVLRLRAGLRRYRPEDRLLRSRRRQTQADPEARRRSCRCTPGGCRARWIAFRNSPKRRA